MKLTTLQGFLNETISTNSFRELIHNEVEDYKLLLSKTGSRVTMVLDEDTDLSIGGDEVTAICQAFIDEPSLNMMSTILWMPYYYQTGLRLQVKAF